MYCSPRSGRVLYRVGAIASLSASPANLPSPTSWIDISQEGAIADGSSMATLIDRAAARTFTSSSPGVYKTNIQNGLPVLRTTSALTAYLASSSLIVGSNAPFCLWFVAKSNDVDAVIWGNNNPNYQVRINYSANRNMTLYNGPNPISTALTLAETTAWNIYMFTRGAVGGTANSIRFYLNGVPKFLGAAAATGISGSFDLGRFLETFNTRFVGDFGEAGVNAADFSAAQLNSLGTYLGAKWAIGWTAIA